VPLHPFFTATFAEERQLWIVSVAYTPHGIGSALCQVPRSPYTRSSQNPVSKKFAESGFHALG
jgi:hypothetical protein